MSDLDKAEELLKNDDVVNVETTASSDYLKGRAVFFNKYAVAATKARVYYAMGDVTNAAKYAKQVIDATNNFSLKKYSSLSDVKRIVIQAEDQFSCCRETLYITQ